MLVGLLPAIIDNSPFIFAVLTMDPQISNGQPLPPQPTLVRFGCSAAPMGMAREVYTFGTHLK